MIMSEGESSSHDDVDGWISAADDVHGWASSIVEGFLFVVVYLFH